MTRDLPAAVRSRLRRARQPDEWKCVMPKVQRLSKSSSSWHWYFVYGLVCASAACDGRMPTSPSRPSPSVVIEAPTGGTIGLTVMFRWHLDNAESGETYRYEVRLDKGVNACDNLIEQAFQADTRTCMVLDLAPAIYDGQRVEFGVRATDSRGQVFCTIGNALSVSNSAAASPACGV